MSWEHVVALGIRGGLGFIFGVLFGIAGLMLTFWAVPEGWVPPIWLVVIVTGVGASIAGFLAWLKPESPWRVMWLGLLLALAGGVAGAWLGYLYGEVVYPEGVRNVQLISTGRLQSPAVVAFITGAAIFTTAVGSIYYGFRLWRYHEV